MRRSGGIKRHCETRFILRTAVHAARGTDRRAPLSTTYSQRGTVAEPVLTAQPLAFVVRGAVGHERPLDHTLGGLGERKGPRHLEDKTHTHTHNT